MAVQNLIEQHLVFTSTSYKFDDNIVNQALITQIAFNSLNKTYYYVMGASFSVPGAAVAPQGGYTELIFIITPAYQATLQSNMPNIVAAFPNYTVVTWGIAISYGF